MDEIVNSNPWVAKALRLLKTRPTDKDFLSIKRACELLVQLSSPAPSLDSKTYLRRCILLFEFGSICPLMPATLKAKSLGKIILEFRADTYPEELIDASEDVKRAVPILMNAVRSVAEYLSCEKHQGQEIPHELEVLASSPATQSAARTVAERLGFPTIVDDVLFWFHFSRGTINKKIAFEALSPAMKAEGIADFEYCIKAKPDYMPSYLHLIHIYNNPSKDALSAYKVACDAMEKAGPSASNWNNYRVVLLMTDLTLSGAASTDGTFTVREVRERIRRFKKYYNPVKDWLPEDVKREEEEKHHKLEAAFPPHIPDDYRMLGGLWLIDPSVIGSSSGKVCDCCGKRDVKQLKCSGCGKVSYCSKECQKKDWKGGHKAVCGGK